MCFVGVTFGGRLGCSECSVFHWLLIVMIGHFEDAFDQSVTVACYGTVMQKATAGYFVQFDPLMAIITRVRLSRSNVLYASQSRVILAPFKGP